MPPVEVIARVKAEGVSETQKGLSTVGDALDDVADRAKQSSEKTKAHGESLKTLSNGALIAGAGLVAGFGAAAHAVMGFDKEMSGVAAVANASAGDLDLLRTAAINAGRDTAFSASEAAAAEGELVKAGVSVSDVLGGALSGSLSLAAAGQLDLAQSATISAQAMNIFNLQGKDVSHIADVLAAAANKSAADVATLGDALQQGGLVAKQTGLGLEDTAGILALFADNALNGSDAGTSMKTMLQRLTPQSDAAAAAMDQLGISAYDSSGQFIGMSAFAQNLQDSLRGLTAEQKSATLNTIFGSDAVRGAAIIMEAGAAGVDEYTKAVNDQGAASRMASAQLDNLAGDLDALKGSFETALIKGGSGANDTLRYLTQTATGLVNAFAEAPSWLQQGATGLAGVAGAGLLAAGAAGTMIPKLKEVKSALAGLSAGQGLALGGVTAALTVGALVLGNYAQKQAEAKQRVEEMTAALIADAGAIGEHTKANLQAQLNSKNQLDDLGRLNGAMSSHRAAIDVLTDAIGGNVASQREFRQALVDSGEMRIAGWVGNDAEHLKKLSEEFVKTGNTATKAGRSNREFMVGNVGLSNTFRDLVGDQAKARDGYDAIKDAEKTAASVTAELTAAQSDLKDMVAKGVTSGTAYEAASKRVVEAQVAQNEITKSVTAATDAANGAQKGLGGQFKVTADEAKAQAEALDSLVKNLYAQEDATRAAYGAGIDYERAQIAVTDAQEAYTKAVKEHGAKSPEAIKAQLDLRDAMLNVGAAGEDAAVKMGELTAQNAGLGTVAEALATTGGVKKLLGGLEAQRDALAPDNPLRAYLQEYIDKLKNDIPDEVKTQLRIEADIITRVGSSTRQVGGTVLPRAGGGTVQAGHPYVVGEVGPEPFFPAVDGRIISHSDAMSALSGGGNGEILAELRALRAAIGRGGVHVTGGIHATDPRKLVDELERRNRRAERLAGVR